VASARHLTTLTLAIALLAGCRQAPDTDAPAPNDVRLGQGDTTMEGLVPPHATLGALLREQLSPDVSASIVDAVRGVFNPRDLRPDRTYQITRTLDGLFREFRYYIDADRFVRVVLRRGDPADATPAYDVEVVPIPKEFEPAAVSAEITHEHNSLVAAFEADGENIQLPLQVADVFGGEVDFNADLNQGDRIDVLFDRAVRDGQFVGYGDLKAAIIDVDSREMTAIRYAAAGQPAAWYDADGRSLKRAFLKSPLPFDPRVTSPFTYHRLHPVLGSVRPHLGVDFGAPYGTRVKAVASGVVEVAGWAGGAGRMVKIRHAGGYETEYLHLSSFESGIHPGARVEQGDLIGRVGQTGLATGPHLDYRVIKNGVYLNPLTAFRDMPAGEPLTADALPQFFAERDAALAELHDRLAATRRTVDPAATR
jgi:murein DD-endopeptidase MepM/ murein hydrolase activator NlpD